MATTPFLLMLLGPDWCSIIDSEYQGTEQTFETEAAPAPQSSQPVHRTTLHCGCEIEQIVENDAVCHSSPSEIAAHLHV
jgi:hypothetical protein